MERALTLLAAVPIASLSVTRETMDFNTVAGSVASTSGGELTMAEIVNLRLARKAARRMAAERQAETNRARHGRTKGEKERDRLEAERLQRRIDGARREDER